MSPGYSATGSYRSSRNLNYDACQRLGRAFYRRCAQNGKRVFIPLFISSISFPRKTPSSVTDHKKRSFFLLVFGWAMSAVRRCTSNVTIDYHWQTRLTFPLRLHWANPTCACGHRVCRGRKPISTSLRILPSSMIRRRISTIKIDWFFFCTRHSYLSIEIGLGTHWSNSYSTNWRNDRQNQSRCKLGKRHSSILVNIQFLTYLWGCSWFSSTSPAVDSM